MLLLGCVAPGWTSQDVTPARKLRQFFEARIRNIDQQKGGKSTERNCATSVGIVSVGVPFDRMHCTAQWATRFTCCVNTRGMRWLTLNTFSRYSPCSAYNLLCWTFCNSLPGASRPCGAHAIPATALMVVIDTSS